MSKVRELISLGYPRWRAWLSIVDYCGLDIHRIGKLSFFLEYVVLYSPDVAKLEWWIDIEKESEEWHAANPAHPSSVPGILRDAPDQVLTRS